MTTSPTCHHEWSVYVHFILHGYYVCWIQDFDALKSMGAVEVQPVLAHVYTKQEAWDMLHERWSL